MESFDNVRTYQSKRPVVRIGTAILILLVIAFLFFGGNKGKLTEEAALSRVPSLALTEAELSLAETILEYEDFRNALNHDLVDNTTAFTLAETASIVGAVIPQGAEVSQIAVSGAVVVIDYSLPYQRVILQYADADRSGTVDQIHKTLEPIISGVTTGCYTVEKNLSTDKIVYTHISY